MEGVIADLHYPVQLLLQGNDGGCSGRPIMNKHLCVKYSLRSVSTILLKHPGFPNSPFDTVYLSLCNYIQAYYWLN